MLKARKNHISPHKMKNTNNVPSQLISLIQQDLAGLDKESKGLSGKILSYVIDGIDESILLVLGGVNNAGEVLHIRSVGGYSGRDEPPSAARRSLFKQIDDLAPEVAYRLARVYHTAWLTHTSLQRRWPHLSPEVEWLEPFICVGLMLQSGWNNMREHQTIWSTGTFARILQAGGHSEAALGELMLSDEPSWGYSYYDSRIFDTIQDQGTYFAKHPAMLAKALSHPKAAHRCHVLEILLKKETALPEETIPVVGELAIGSAKTVRTAAYALLKAQDQNVRTRVSGWLKDKLQNGSATERFNSVGMLILLDGEEAKGFLKEQLEKDKSKKVVAEIQKYLMIQSDSAEDDDSGYKDGLVLPDIQSFSEEYSVSPELEKNLLELVEQYNTEAMDLHTSRWDRTDRRWRQGSRTIQPPIKKGTVQFICKGLANPELVKKRKQPCMNVPDSYLLYGQLGDFVKRHKVPLVPMIRLGFLFGMIMGEDSERYNAYFIQEDIVEWIAWFRDEHDPTLSLLDLAAAFSAAGLSEVWVVKLYLDAGFRSTWNPLSLDEEKIWPLFHRNPVYLEDALGLSEKVLKVSDYWKTDLRHVAFKVLATFPKPSEKFVNLLWDVALGTGKIERPLAQACLVNYPGRDQLIIAALDDGRKEIRTAAARWLGQLEVKEAVGPIKKTLDKEKYDEPKAQMMESLEILGEDIDRFLNRSKLKKEAEKGLSKALHKDIAWFPFDRLPEVHWEKNRQKVAPEIIRWFVVQAQKLKNPEPGPLYRRYFNLMRPDEREKLGSFVLEAWLAHDTVPKYTHEEASELADQSLANIVQHAKQYPEYYQDLDEEQYRKSSLNHYLNECMGSATPSKGILAISAACCGSEIVAPVERYLKQWYGRRMTQCKVLIRMLSWVDHPLAIQLILATATRFRTRGIQKEAAICAELIAERKGWSLDEMADRTIPTAGFDINGFQEIDYGTRKFTARLLVDFSIQLENNKGKTIKNLPPANKAEDEDEVKAAKKEFTAAKKEIKQVLKHQKERLYEAMCTRRSWRFEDWDLYLNNHPIVSRFCRKLVWIALEPKTGEDAEPRFQAFRSTSDRVLTDVDDETVELSPDHSIHIAHQSLFSADEAGAWREHLDDYEIEPLFEQFRESQFELSPEKLACREIKDYEGYLINSFKLRSIMNKLGYTRGMAEDGGWFYTYNKSFPGLQRQAVIEFTGNTLPEENRMVGLMKLYFIEIQEDSQDGYAYSHKPLKLSEIPAVMALECCNDLKTMADEGAGYDAEWQKKTEY